LKSIFRIGVPFGLMMAVFNYFDGEEFSIFQFVFMSLFFGLVMTFTFVPYHIERIKELDIKEFSDEVLSSNQKLEVQSAVTRDDLLHKLENSSLLNISKISTTEHSIRILTKAESTTFGEKIEIKFKEIEGGMDKLLITSRPRLITKFIDNGNNLRNVQTIQKLIKGTV